jgi:hypothetical protein
MIKLILPPVGEVKDIVLDMMPTITPDADPDLIRESVELAESLVSLFNRASGDPTTQAVLQAMLGGMVARTNCIDNIDSTEMHTLH